MEKKKVEDYYHKLFKEEPDINWSDQFEELKESFPFGNVADNIEALRKKNRMDYITTFYRLPQYGCFENLLDILNVLWWIIDDIEYIMSLSVSIEKKKNRLQKAEQKIGILLSYMSDVIINYVGPIENIDIAENTQKECEFFLYRTEQFFDSLSKDAELEDYYDKEIRYYRFFHDYIKSAVYRYDKRLLWCTSLCIPSILVYRTDIMVSDFLK